MDKTYNGWANYETWIVNLWIDNDQSAQEYWAERATELLAHPQSYGPGDGTRDAKFSLADEMKDSFEESSSEFELSGVFGDLLNAALSEVKWDEIATHYIESAKEDAAV